MSTNDFLPDDVETLRQLVLARDVELTQARVEAASARAEAANARAEASSAEALITHLRLEIEKLKRDLFGPRNKRKARLLDQMELELEELEAGRHRGRTRGREGRSGDRRPDAGPRLQPHSGRHASRSPRICRASG